MHTRVFVKWAGAGLVEGAALQPQLLSSVGSYLVLTPSGRRRLSVTPLPIPYFLAEMVMG